MIILMLFCFLKKKCFSEKSDDNSDSSKKKAFLKKYFPDNYFDSSDDSNDSNDDSNDSNDEIDKMSEKSSKFFFLSELDKGINKLQGFRDRCSNKPSDPSLLRLIKDINKLKKKRKRVLKKLNTIKH